MKWYYLLAIIAATALVTTMIIKRANAAQQCPTGKTWDAVSKTCK